MTQKLALFVAAGIVSPHLELFRWDAGWYHKVIVDGYQSVAPGVKAPLSDLAFFPLYPGLADLVHRASGLGVEVSLTVVAWLGTLAAAWGIFVLAKHVGGSRVGILCVALWGAAPRGFVEILPYTEGLFTAFAAWSLYHLLRRRPLLAGLFCGLAGATRAAVVPLIAVLALSWAVAVWRDARTRGLGPALLSPESWRGIGATGLGASGLTAYWLYVAVRTGSFTGYLQVQAQWHTSMSWPTTGLVRVLQVLRDGAGVFVYWRYVALVVLVYLALIVVLVLRERRWELSLFAVLSWVWAVAAKGYFTSKARFLLPVFVVWIPVARWLARRHLIVAVAVVVGFTVLNGIVDIVVWNSHTSP